MKLQPYVDKLNSSHEYKEFHSKNKDAFITAGFFVLDLETQKNLHQIDFYIPSKKKVAAFTLDNRVTMQVLDMLNRKTPEKLDIKTKIDLDQLHGILQDEMKNRSITDEIKKIIAVIQTLDGKKIWNLSCILSGMGILTAHVEDESKSVLKMEKRSMFDLIQKIPSSALKSQVPNAAAEANKGQSQEKPSNIKDDLKKLDELEQAIKEEKEEILKQKKASESKPVKKTSKKSQK